MLTYIKAMKPFFVVLMLLSICLGQSTVLAEPVLSADMQSPVTSWIITTVAADGIQRTGKEHALAIDPNDQPHISYLDESSNTLKYASLVNGQWQSVTIDSTSGAGAENALVFDRSGTPHISYINWQLDLVKYATVSNGTWLTSTVDTVYSWATDITVSSTGVPFVGYTSYYDGDYEYAVPLGQTWLKKSIHWYSHTVNSVSIAFDRQDQLSFGATDGDSAVVNKSIDLFVLRNNVWSSTGLTGSCGDMKLDAQGVAHFSLTRDGKVMYATRLENNPNANFEIVEVDSTVNVKNGTSLALDSKGFPHIAYIDTTLNAVRYARWDGSQWILQTVALSKPYNFYLSTKGQIDIALDSKDRPHISFYDDTDKSLKYAVTRMQFLLPLVVADR